VLVLYFIAKNVTTNGRRYKVLKNHLLPFMGIYRASHFLQDGAPCHTSKMVKDFLKEKGGHVYGLTRELP
jgi:hypothetical protein